jgi:hypothetical protein
MADLNITSTAWQTFTSTGSWGGTVFYLGAFIFLPIFVVIVGMAVLWNIASYTRVKKY